MLFEKEFSADRYEEIQTFLKQYKNKYTGFVVEQICDTGSSFLDSPLFLIAEHMVISFCWYGYTGEITLTGYERGEFFSHVSGSLFRDPRYGKEDFVYIYLPHAEEVHQPIRSIKLLHSRWAGKRLLSGIDVQFINKQLQIFPDDLIEDMTNYLLHDKS